MARVKPVVIEPSNPRTLLDDQPSFSFPFPFRVIIPAGHKREAMVPGRLFRYTYPIFPNAGRACYRSALLKLLTTTLSST
ncbi:MAG: hypothetical protein WAU17_09050 [Nitrospirales bacterium]